MSRPFWKEPLPSPHHQVIPHSGHNDDGGVYDGSEMLTVQEMLKEKRRNESNYLQVRMINLINVCFFMCNYFLIKLIFFFPQLLQMANSAALLAGTATAVSRSSFENYSSGDQGG